jgi:hypothetical protein
LVAMMKVLANLSCSNKRCLTFFVDFSSKLKKLVAAPGKGYKEAPARSGKSVNGGLKKQQQKATTKKPTATQQVRIATYPGVFRHTIGKESMAAVHLVNGRFWLDFKHFGTSGSYKEILKCVVIFRQSSSFACSMRRLCLVSGTRCLESVYHSCFCCEYV